MRMFGLIGLVLVLCAGAFISMRLSKRMSTMPEGVGFGQPSVRLDGPSGAGLEGGEAAAAKNIPADVEKKLKKITEKYPEVKD